MALLLSAGRAASRMPHGAGMILSVSTMVVIYGAVAAIALT